MAYPQEVMNLALTRRSNAFDTAENLAAATGVYGQYIAMKPIKVTRLMFVVTTQTLSGLGNPVLTFFRRPTAGSTSGQVSLGTLTIPSASVVGTVVYKDINPVTINAGEEISFTRTTQATDGGTAAGLGFYGVMCELKTESPINSGGPAMVASV